MEKLIAKFVAVRAMYECNCGRCNNDDVPEVHDICACLDCHEAACHEMPEQWANECVNCDRYLEEMGEFYATELRKKGQEALESRQENGRDIS